MARAKLGARAFIVDVEDHGSEVVYAGRASDARNGGMTEWPYIERTVRRAPELDRFLGKGGPTQADLLEHGWWFNCHWNPPKPEDSCPEEQVLNETGGIHEEQVYCWKHLAMVKGIDAAPVLERLKGFAVEYGYWDPENPINDRVVLYYSNTEHMERMSEEIRHAFGVIIPAYNEHGMNMADASDLHLDSLAAYIALLQMNTAAIERQKE